ncbi:MAG TPA: DUF2336 domain-containing protein [Stellaceae bacterium]|nr:DUF2336 domain-containing protein [Stellaceae bacterium]
MPTSHHAPAALLDICNRLQVDAAVGVRTDTAKHVGALFSSETLTSSERQAALAILEKLIQDVEQEVRHALATHVASCAFLPAPLARAIAEDIEAISVPFIRISPALADADLVAIIAAGSEEKQMAIAARETVSERVTEALTDTHRAAVVTTLLRNDGAQLSEGSYHAILNDFAGDASVQNLLIDRDSLPLTVTDRLVHVVSAELHDRLVEKHALPSQLADELLTQARERTMMHGVASIPRSFDVERLAHLLNRRGELTPTLLMRALCEGDMQFFEAGMAALAGVALENSAALIADGGPLGFKALYEKAGLPINFFRAFRAALDVHARLKVDSQESWSSANLQLILDRVMLEYDEACPGDLEYLLSQMSHQILGRADHQWRR